MHTWPHPTVSYHSAPSPLHLPLMSTRYDGVRNACLIGRYFFLVALILQAIGMIIAVYLRVRRPPTYDEYKEFENDAERQLQRSVQNAVQMEELSAATTGRQAAAPGGPPQLSRLTAASLYAKTSSSRWGRR